MASPECLRSKDFQPFWIRAGELGGVYSAGSAAQICKVFLKEQVFHGVCVYG
jgi:hypothetical protein